jgi:hypothetical protein
MHMSRMRFILLGLTATAALSGVMATSALAAAPEWWVQKKVIAANEKIEPKLVVKSALTIKTSKLSIECTEDTVENGEIRPGNKNSMKKLIIGGCKVPGSPGCVVPAIETVPLTFSLTRLEEKGEVKLNFAPEVGHSLAKFKIPASEACSAPTTVELTTGEKAGMQCNYPGVEVEQIKHELNFGEGTGSEIVLNGEKAVFTGVVFFKLVSGKEWSAK